MNRTLINEETTNLQQRYLKAFIERYTKRTETSKQLTQTYRPVLANSRASFGFCLSIKEILYPIIGKQAQGSRMWDVDGNEYIDLGGFGVNLFGNNPPFIKEALAAQLEQGIQISPQAEFAGEVALLISELTGMERVTFLNSGTEAVMTALRLARSATNRYKIALFSGSYHGHSDGTLMIAHKGAENPRAVPLARGISSNIAEDVLVLDYGNFESLEVIKAYASELAAVLVEPVQSRRPELQPQAFLQQLRELTQESGIALIFDEMVTGFRIHPGGAQAWFGVEADLATYGKIIGGGMPIGVVAGKATYMDGVDGGMWNYGDESYPQAKTTFVAGTFSKHPLAMAAARVVLQHLKSQGSGLQQQLNQRTSQFVETLNAYFEANKVPLGVANFGSFFGPVLLGNATSNHSTVSENIDLLLYHLLAKGIYLRGGCFLSTAHTDEDIDCIIHAIKDSVEEMQEGGFLVDSYS
ncbi:MAG: aspartate aminotransferase family protein [Tolypothrix brevis GSE-NOS-MK-07-07A]|nr:aspartate aminotransferase family protein [Tolypothrix brevis GSE-NOS-MK-07-07A]